MAYPRSRMRTSSPVQDNRRKPSAIRWKQSGKVRSMKPLSSFRVNIGDRDFGLVRQGNTILGGRNLWNEQQAIFSDQSPAMQRLNAPEEGSILPPMPMRPSTAAMPSGGGLRAGVTPDVGDIMGPNAAFLLSGAPRPPIRSGWRSRYGAMAPAAPVAPEPMTPQDARYLRGGVRQARADEYMDLVGDRSERGMMARPRTPDEQAQGMVEPLTTHFGGSRMGVSSMPRPLSTVGSELSGRASFDRAAGPMNEAWMGANETRDAAREMRMENVRRKAAQEAAQRAQRMEQRNVPISPMTAMMGGLYRQGGPQAVANFAIQQGRMNQLGAAQAAQQRFAERQWNEGAAQRGEELTAARNQNRMMEQAMTEEAELKREIGETQDRLAGAPEGSELQRQLEDELDDLNERLNGVRDRQAGLAGGGSLRPETAGAGEFTSDDQRKWNSIRRTPASTMPQTVGDLSIQAPEDTAESLVGWATNGQNENAPMPPDSEIKGVMPRLAERPHEITVDKEFMPQGEARGQAIRLAAQPLPGDKKDDAVARVKALMKYLQSPKNRRKLPRVGDYRLKIDYRPAGHGEAQIGVTGLPVYTDYHGPGYKYSWQKVK